jgi:two-component system cell cycle sensor histidine kinase/response regulator CckA
MNGTLRPDATNPQAAAPSQKQATILVADDEAAVRDVASLALRKAGYRVLTAKDGIEAVRLWNEHADAICLALLDCSMPECGGPEAAEQMWMLRPELPVILCSGHAPPTGGPDSPIGRAARFLPKPFNLASLIEAVREVLDRSKIR